METTAIAGKRQRCSQEAEPSTNAAETAAAAVLVPSRPRVPLPEALSGELLWHSLVHLPISDIARSERICREWRHILRSDDANAGRAVWRKVAIRSSSEAAVDALAATFASHDEDGRVDFKRLAVCLAKEPPKAKPPPTPTLRPQDLFAFVHLEERSIGSGAEGQTICKYQTVGAYTIADCSPLFERYEDGTHGIVQCEELDLIVEGANPMARGAAEAGGSTRFSPRDPFKDAFRVGLRHPNRVEYVVTVRLFRKGGGTLRSICVMKRESIADIDERGLTVLYQPFEDCITATLATGTTQAAAALSAMRENEIGDGYFSATLWFEPVGLPSPEEEGWASTLRNALRERALSIDWSDADREELANISSFKFRLSKLMISLDIRHVDRDKTEPRISTTEMLLILEGLAWE